MYGKSDGQPPFIFFLILICFGAVLVTGGLRRWPFLLKSGVLSVLVNRFLLSSSEETDNYVAAFYIICGVITIISGLIGLFIVTK